MDGSKNIRVSRQLHEIEHYIIVADFAPKASSFKFEGGNGIFSCLEGVMISMWIFVGLQKKGAQWWRRKGVIQEWCAACWQLLILLR